MRSAPLWPLLALLAALASLRLGAVDVPWVEIAHWIFGGADDSTGALLSRYRGPRTAAAALVGAHFAVSGMILQIVLRNPLADPTIFGISGGAALAVVGSMVVAVSVAAPATGVIIPADYVPMHFVPFIALFGALLATAAMLALSWDGGWRPRPTALTGIVLGAVLSAIVMAGVLSLPEAQTQLAVLWLSGSLYARNLAQVWTILPWTLAGLAATGLLLRHLSLLRFDTASAVSQGIDVASIRVLLILTSAGLAASAVAVAGPVGFVGLLVPHAVRRLVGPDLRLQLWLNIWAGAVLVMLSDGFGRAVLAPVEVPVGIVTSLMGAPYLIYLLSSAQGAAR